MFSCVSIREADSDERSDISTAGEGIDSDGARREACGLENRGGGVVMLSVCSVATEMSPKRSAFATTRNYQEKLIK